MADGRYIDDPLLSSVTGSEKFPIESGGLDYHTTPSVVVDFAKEELKPTFLQINPRVFQTAFAATFVPDIDSYDRFEQTAASGNITINPPTGSARNFRYIVLRFTPTGSDRTLTWDAIYEAGNVPLPTSAPVGESTEVFLEYNSSASKWRCVGINSGGGGGSGTGTVNTGSANSIAYYATTGDAVSEIATANNSTLVTDGTGVPSLSQTLPSAVQANITTLGTITTGVWNGSVIPGQFGGNGVNNAGKTITVGGNFSTVGAYTLALNLTANTSVTLPTTGTLSTLAGTETLTNKTIGSGSSYTGGSISATYTEAKIKGTTGSSANRIVLTNTTADTVKETSQAFIVDGSTTTFQLNGTTGGSGQIVATTELYISVNNAGSSIIFRPAYTEKFRMTSTGLRVNGSGNPTEALQVSGNIYMDGATNTLKYRSGTNQRCGTATLVAGTVTVSNTTVASTTEIRLTRKTLGTSPGYLSYSKINSTSFTITSSDPADDGVILYELIEIV